MKIAAARVESFLRRPNPAARAVLLYGPDGGMVRERAALLTRSVVADPGDPFRVAELSGAVLAADRARLADEAAAIAFGGGRRVVRVRQAGDEAAPAFAAFLDDPRGDALIVVEAGNLGSGSKLRKLFEASPVAAALPCYADDSESLEALIVRHLAEDRITIAPEALDFLVGHLGSDRMVTRSELDKLALYAGPGGRVELADAEACVGDSAVLSLDAVAYAVGSGDVKQVLRALDRAYAEGESPVRVLRAVGGHFQRLHAAASRVAAGMPVPKAMDTLRPKVFWKQQEAFRAQLRRWPLAWLGTAIERLIRAEIDCKSTGMPDQAVCTRTLMEIARAAGRLPG